MNFDSINSIIKILIVLTFVLLIMSTITQEHNNKVEGFIFNANMESNNDCYNLPHEACVNCENCGVCISRDGDVKCVPGDINGPFFESDCKYWISKEPSNKKDRQLIVSRPWSFLYPGVKWDYFLTSREFIDMPRYN